MAKIPILRKGKESRDAGSNFQDVVLRLKIGVTLERPREEPGQIIIYEVSSEHEQRARNVVRGRHCGPSSSEVLLQVTLKAMKVAASALREAPCNSRGLQRRQQARASPNYKLKKVEKKRLLPLQSVPWTNTSGCSQWLARQGPPLSAGADPPGGERSRPHTDVRSELSSRKWGPQSLEEETGPCVRGQVGHGLQVRPTEEQELVRREERRR